MKKFWTFMAVMLFSAIAFSSNTLAAQDNITAEYFIEASYIIVKGSSGETDIRKPITVSLCDSNGILYAAQKRAGTGDFEFKIPYTLYDSLDNYSVYVNINGRAGTVLLTEGVPFTASKKWIPEENVLKVYGNYVWTGYGADNLVQIEMTNSAGETVFADSVSAGSEYSYEFNIDFSTIANDKYEIEVYTAQDAVNITFNYLETEVILSSLKDKTGAEIKNILTGSAELLDISSWTAINGQDIIQLSDDVYDILSGDVESITDTNELKQKINRAVMVDMLNNASDAEEAEEIIMQVAAPVFNIRTIPVIALYDDLGTLQGKVFEAVYNVEKFDSFDKVVEFITDEVLLQGINKCEHWSQLKELVDEYSECMTVNGVMSNSGYSVLVAAIPYENLNMFEKKYKEALSNTGTGGSGGGGGGGGGSSRNPDVAQKPDVEAIPAVSVESEKDKVNSNGNGTSRSNVFSDIGSVEWAKTAILALYEQGIINGVGNGKFEPNTYVTREQFTTMIVKAFDLSKNSDETNSFSDVNAQEWYSLYIDIAYSNGIIHGKDDGSCGIGETITRQDVAALIYRALLQQNRKKEMTHDISFADESEISDYAKEAVMYLADAGLISGVGDNRFEPKSLCTRAQAARIIYAVLND